MTVVMILPPSIVSRQELLAAKFRHDVHEDALLTRAHGPKFVPSLAAYRAFVAWGLSRCEWIAACPGAEEQTCNDS
jgi:hypothetical protein